jgi:hypothetical protein
MIEDAISKFLNAKYKGNLELAYSMLTTNDKDAMPYILYEIENDLPEGPLVKMLSESIEFETTKIKVMDAKAIATVDMSIPDYTFVMKEIMGTTLLSALTKDMHPNEKVISDFLSKNTIPRKEKKLQINLRKEGENWRIFEDLDTKVTISALLSKAKNFEEENNYEKSIQLYDSILVLNPFSEEVRNKKINAEIEQMKYKKKQYYINKLQLYKFKARYYETYFDGNVPGVRFKIKNNSSKTLKFVVVKVFFEDKNGEIIHEEKVTPVNTSQLFFGDRRPLKSGHIWQMERNQYYKMEKVPSEWKPGAAFAKIIDVEIQ